MHHRQASCSTKTVNSVIQGSTLGGFFGLGFTLYTSLQDNVMPKRKIPLAMLKSGGSYGLLLATVSGVFTAVQCRLDSTFGKKREHATLAGTLAGAIAFTPEAIMARRPHPALLGATVVGLAATLLAGIAEQPTVSDSRR